MHKINTQCPHCEIRLKVAAKLVNQTRRCPKCKRGFLILEMATIAPAKVQSAQKGESVKRFRTRRHEFSVQDNCSLKRIYYRTNPKYLRAVNFSCLSLLIVAFWMQLHSAQGTADDSVVITQTGPQQAEAPQNSSSKRSTESRKPETRQPPELTPLQNFSLGENFEEGRTVPKDEMKARKYMKKAADAGLPQGMDRYAYYLRTGIGGAKDARTAKTYYEKAAAQGFVNSMYNLGSMYYVGEGIEKDYKKSFKWHLMAAENGDADSQCLTGLAYKYGSGTDSDYSLAVYWLKQAAEQGDTESEVQLGHIFVHPESGDLMDLSKARYWYGRAAESGNKKAISQLKLMRQDDINKGLNAFFNAFGSGGSIQQSDYDRWADDAHRARNRHRMPFGK